MLSTSHRSRKEVVVVGPFVIMRLALCVAVVAMAAAALSSGIIGSAAGVQDAHATHPCDTTAYWNVSWCLYHESTGQTKERACCSINQSAYNETTGICIKFLHTTAGGGWYSAPNVCSGQSWTFYNVASNDRIGCFHFVNGSGNQWINCRRANA